MNTHPKYILVVRGRVLEEGDDPEEMMSRHNLDPLGGGTVMSWRLHQWINGDPNSNIFKDEHCKNCKTTRQRSGSLESKPCKGAKNSDDDTVEVFKYHPEHTSDRCCNEHGHHADMMHVNCFLR